MEVNLKVKNNIFALFLIFLNQCLYRIFCNHWFNICICLYVCMHAYIHTDNRNFSLNESSLSNFALFTDYVENPQRSGTYLNCDCQWKITGGLVKIEHLNTEWWFSHDSYLWACTFLIEAMSKLCTCSSNKNPQKYIDFTHKQKYTCILGKKSVMGSGAPCTCTYESPLHYTQSCTYKFQFTYSLDHASVYEKNASDQNGNFLCIIINASWKW